MSAGRQIETILANPPDYFRSIQERATKRWDQLEADPELAGPWHQLFKQVQSPRHILSELLQNADDAGASEARVSIENDRFVFEHNGEDFIEAHFASICRFGYSNKRALHTIGFQVSASTIGIIGITTFAGIVAQRTTLTAIPVIMVICSVIVIGLDTVLRRQTDERPGEAAA